MGSESTEHHNDEKHQSLAVDDLEREHQHHLDKDVDHGFDPAEVRRVIRKVDLRLVPILALMYCISLMDRTNLSLARAANGSQMNIDLGMKAGSSSYSIVVCVFFITYTLFEVPSQIGLRALGPRIWLSSAVILWGVIMLLMGYSNTWQQMAGLRVLLGFFEAALFPGASYLISTWYVRKQMASRNAMFYVLSNSVSGLSSVLTYGVSQMHGLQNKHGWRWIFIIYGTMTMLIGVLGLIFVEDFPDRAKFLTEDERALVTTRIERDRDDAESDSMTWPKFVSYLCDLKIWLFGFFFGCTTLSAYAFSYFLPVILHHMGFSTVLCQVLVAPPYVYFAIPCLLSGYFSDRFQVRSPFIIVNSLIIIIGTALYTQIANRGVQYFGIFLAIGGANTNIPLIVAWSQTAIRSQSKRGFNSGLVIAWGGIGGIVASVSFMDKEALKGYPTGINLTFALQAVVACGTGLLALHFKRQNKRADNGEVILEGHPDFRYHT